MNERRTGGSRCPTLGETRDPLEPSLERLHRLGLWLSRTHCRELGGRATQRGGVVVDFVGRAQRRTPAVQEGAVHDGVGPGASGGGRLQRGGASCRAEGCVQVGISGGGVYPQKKKTTQTN